MAIRQLVTVEQGNVDDPYNPDNRTHVATIFTYRVSGPEDISGS